MKNKILTILSLNHYIDLNNFYSIHIHCNDISLQGQFKDELFIQIVDNGFVYKNKHEANDKIFHNFVFNNISIILVE